MAAAIIWVSPRRARFGFLPNNQLKTNFSTRHHHSCIKAKARSSEIQRFGLSKLPKHLGHNHREKHDPHEGKEGRLITWVGVGADVLLSVGKMVAGILGNSSALVADALHSLSDIVIDGVTLWTHALARRPWSEQHPYGFGKFETIGAMAVSISLILTGFGIMAHAGNHMLNMNGEMIPTSLALAAAFVSLVVKELLFRRTMAIAKAEGSDLIAANAWHHRSDAISSLVALLGVAGAMAGFPMLDPLAGAAVACLIAYQGYEMFVKSIKELTDNQEVDQETIQAISKLIASFPEIRGHHNLRSRKMGVYSLVDLHITVDPRTTVTSAHQTAEKARTLILETLPQVREALIHVEGAVLNGDIPYHENFKLYPAQSEVEEDIRNTLTTHFPQIVDCHRFSIHYIGDSIEAVFSISVSDQLQITDAKQVASKAATKIKEEIPYITTVIIRLELTTQPAL